MSHFRLYPAHPTLPHSSINHSLTSTYLIHTMPSTKKISKREHSEREIAAILVLHVKGYSAREIGDEINVPKLIINKII
jgi:hypothetical protein